MLIGHDLDALAELASPDILIHPTAMPCEASYYGINGVGDWLGEGWKAFPDLTVADDYRELGWSERSHRNGDDRRNN